MKGPRVLFSRGHTPGLHSPLEKEAPGPSSSQKGSQRWARSCYGHIEMRGYLDRREPTMCQALSTSKALTASVSLSPLGSKLVRTQVRAQHGKSPPPSTTNLTRGG